MKTFCQVVLIIFLLYGMFRELHKDINGQVAKPPGQYSDVVTTIISFILTTLLLWKAGAFSELL